MYVWMVRMVLKRAGGFPFLLRKHCFLGLTPVSSDTTALSKFYFKRKLKIVREFLRKCLFFKSQKVSATGYYDIENLLPDVIKISPLFRC